MKILYHHRTQGKGGEGVHIREIIIALRNMGHEVFVVSPPGVDVFSEAPQKIYSLKQKVLSGMWSWISKNTPETIFEFMEMAYNFSARGKIKRALKRQHIDLIYERYAFFMQAGGEMAARYKIPLILEVNEVSGIKRQRKQVLVDIANGIEQMIFSRANAIVTVSSFLKEEIVKRGVDPRKVFVLPNAIDPERFHPGISGAQTRERLNLNGQTTMSFIGQFSKWDRLDFLVEVFSQVLKERPKVSLLIIGDGAQRKKLEGLIKAKRLGDSVFLTGKIDRGSIPEYIAATDICVIPHSNPFGSPLVLLEYLAMGKPAVAPRLGPIEDITGSAENCVLFDPENAEALKRELVSLIDHPEKRQAIGVEARKTILASRTWTHNADKIVEIYGQIKAN